jgi:hypothetical protein
MTKDYPDGNAAIAWEMLTLFRTITFNFHLWKEEFVLLINLSLLKRFDES